MFSKTRRAMVNVLGTRRLKNKPQKKGVLVRFDNIVVAIINSNRSVGFRFASIGRLVDVNSDCNRRIDESRFICNRF